MTHAIRIHAQGGPEVLRYEEVAVGAPGPGEARVRHTAIGVNYIDTYHRSGQYKVALPSGIGMEGAGVVEAGGARERPQPKVSVARPGDGLDGALRQPVLLGPDHLLVAAEDPLGAERLGVRRRADEKGHTEGEEANGQAYRTLGAGTL